MKRTLKIGGSILIAMIVLLVTLRATGLEPRDCANAGVSWTCRTPGLWLKGELVTTPVTDWSFTDQIQTIKIQTETPVFLPYSVAIWCAAYKGDLPMVTWEKIVEHIDHAVKVAGADHVGLGSDFDGATMPLGMEDATKLPKITDALLKKGYSEPDVEKILGGNILRVMEQVERAAGSGAKAGTQP